MDKTVEAYHSRVLDLFSKKIREFGAEINSLTLEKIELIDKMQNCMITHRDWLALNNRKIRVDDRIEGLSKERDAWMYARECAFQAMDELSAEEG